MIEYYKNPYEEWKNMEKNKIDGNRKAYLIGFMAMLVLVLAAVIPYMLYNDKQVQKYAEGKK